MAKKIIMLSKIGISIIFSNFNLKFVSERWPFKEMASEGLIARGSQILRESLKGGTKLGSCTAGSKTQSLMILG